MPSEPMSDIPTTTIDTGDVVLHGPTGERWVVAYVKDDRLAWCGWPNGEAKLSDCHLLKEATDAERLELLQKLAEMNSDSDSRKSYARWRLGLR